MPPTFAGLPADLPPTKTTTQHDLRNAGTAAALAAAPKPSGFGPLPPEVARAMEPAAPFVLDTTPRDLPMSKSMEAAISASYGGR